MDGSSVGEYLQQIDWSHTSLSTETTMYIPLILYQDPKIVEAMTEKGIRLAIIDRVTFSLYLVAGWSSGNRLVLPKTFWLEATLSVYIIQNICVGVLQLLYHVCNKYSKICKIWTVNWKDKDILLSSFTQRKSPESSIL